MTLAELRTELRARGFDTLGSTNTRADAILNAAISEVDMAYPWPFLEDSGTGTAPLTVSDLGQIEAVTDEDNVRRLEVVNYGNLLDWFGDLSVTGNAQFAYVAHPAGVPTVATYPVSTATIGVQYYRVPDALSADGDTPAAPARFHHVYLAVASRMAAAESDGNVALWSAEADRGLQAMMMSLLPDQLAGVHQRVSGESADW